MKKKPPPPPKTPKPLGDYLAPPPPPDAPKATRAINFDEADAFFHRLTQSGTLASETIVKAINYFAMNGYPVMTVGHFAEAHLVSFRIHDMKEQRSVTACGDDRKPVDVLRALLVNLREGKYEYDNARHVTGNGAGKHTRNLQTPRAPVAGAHLENDEAHAVDSTRRGSMAHDGGALLADQPSIRREEGSSPGNRQHDDLF